MGKSSNYYLEKGSMAGTVTGTQEEPWSPSEGTTTANPHPHWPLFISLCSLLWLFPKSRPSRRQTAGAFINRMLESQFSAILNGGENET